MNTSLFPNPAYILDQKLLEENLRILAHVKKESEVEIILAFKSFASWGAFPFFNTAGFTCATASSLNEARLCVEEMGTFAHTYSPVYVSEEIEEIAALSSHLTFNSISQYRRFHEIARKSNKNISFGLRVNPELSQVQTDLYNPCIVGSRLGVLKSDLPDILPDKIEGLHIHALCESNAEQSVALLHEVEEKFGSYFSQLKWLNFGGGHLMTRKGYNLDLLIKSVKDFKNRYPYLRIILEPGSAFTWETGVLLARVEDIVENSGVKTILLNVSFSAHMPDCLEMPYKPNIEGAVDPDKLSAKEAEKIKGFRYRIGGNTCLSGDVMGDWIFENILQIGDSVIFKDMIHYTIVKTTMFNGVKHPAICIENDGELSYCKEFSYEDYRNRLS